MKNLILPFILLASSCTSNNNSSQIKEIIYEGIQDLSLKKSYSFERKVFFGVKGILPLCSKYEIDKVNFYLLELSLNNKDISSVAYSIYLFILNYRYNKSHEDKIDKNLLDFKGNNEFIKKVSNLQNFEELYKKYLNTVYLSSKKGTVLNKNIKLID